MAPSSRLDPLSLGAMVLTVVVCVSAFVGIRAGLKAFSPEYLTLCRFLVMAVGWYTLAPRLLMPSAASLLGGAVALGGVLLVSTLGRPPKAVTEQAT